MSDYSICPHGEKVAREACPQCVAEFEALPAVDTLNADQRGDEIMRLCTEASWAGFERIWKRIDQCVGRGTYTHELARPVLLAREARNQEHPADLEAHLVGLMDQLMGDKPVHVVRFDDGGES